VILHPGILALITGATLSLFLLGFASFCGLIIQHRWDFSSSSEYQLQLERRTYLVSTLTNVALWLQIASLLLFVYTVEEIHPLFTGAMCATGSLNANPIGWWALLLKILSFFLCGFWLVLDNIDQRSAFYPLIKLKYRLLLGVFPMVVLDYTLQMTYFLQLSPDIITSCCGSLFSTDNTSAISNITSLAPFPSLLLFIISSMALVSAITCALFFNSSLLRYMLLVAGVVYFIASITVIIALVSTYIYELPTHHCPFDILQKQYNFIGYPLFLFLFTGTFYTILPGLFAPLRNHHLLQSLIAARERRWMYQALSAITLFIGLTCIAISTSNLRYFS